MGSSLNLTLCAFFPSPRLTLQKSNACSFLHSYGRSTLLTPCPPLIFKATYVPSSCRPQLGHALGSEALSGAQVMDISSEGVEDIGIEQLDLIAHRKTGLLVDWSTVSGAIFGGAGKDEVVRLRKYARSFGLMAQVVDDILDWDKDQAAGKATHPKILGLEKAKEVAEKLNMETKGPLIALANYIHSYPQH